MIHIHLVNILEFTIFMSLPTLSLSHAQSILRNNVMCVHTKTYCQLYNMLAFELQWALLATIKSGDCGVAMSILQEKCADLDLNCQDYVRTCMVDFSCA